MVGAGVVIWLASVGYLQSRAAGFDDSPRRTVTASVQTASSKEASPEQSAARALLDQYCVRCHNERLRTAGLSLSQLVVRQTSGDDEEIWEKVVRKLRTREMPGSSPLRFS